MVEKRLELIAGHPMDGMDGCDDGFRSRSEYSVEGGCIVYDWRYLNRTHVKRLDIYISEYEVKKKAEGISCLWHCS